MPSDLPIHRLTDGERIRYGRMLRGRGRSREAEHVFQAVLQSDADNPYALLGLGQARLDQLDAGGAIGPIEMAAKRLRGCLDVHHSLAVAYGICGDHERSSWNFNQALRISPYDPGVILDYSKSRRFSAHDGLLERIDRSLIAPGLARKQITGLHFAAGKILDDLGSYDNAWSRFRIANESVSGRFSVEWWEKVVHESIIFFDAIKMKNLRAKAASTPGIIFVFGCPRSGTTLVEQILSSHPCVDGIGEKSTLSQVAARMVKELGSKERFPQCMNRLTDTQVTELAGWYCRQVFSSNMSQDCRVCDKTPSNFVYVGMINAVFQDACLVHCRRNTLDTILSCYFTYFRSGQEYSYDVLDLANYYAGYQRLIRHWESVSAARIHAVQYERIVDEQEAATTDLLENLGLRWHEGCLSFHQTRRKVATASSWQVRQPLYSHSVDRWKNYEKFLNPLVDALDRLGVHWDSYTRTDESHPIDYARSKRHGRHANKRITRGRDLG
ncbi:Sulfotransferase domain protein [Crateriforma conspicua]|uniref:Sulfotransferase domain protein n=2 Tax=Crateriforma conspicua TaxID=2527996 RepID=A0A5C5XSA8_9PLAN|nr:Sulfotransferase domain protein [Crateriforma conspicua]